MRDELQAGALAGHLVLVGTSAAGLLDIKPTSLGIAMPGVEIQAQLLATILAGDHLQRPNYAAGAEFLLTMAISLVMLVRSEEHTSELQSLMRISYAVFCLKKNTKRTSTVTYNSKC